MQRGLLEASVGGIPTSDLPRLEQDRKLLAGWVILLDKTLAAMDLAVRVEQQGGGGLGAAALTEAAIDVRVLAEAVKASRLSD